ncbi:MAG: DUF4159 domain-containing protein [Planctomycetes bacterium]|nr:DUF4159 domain-containing protein [Planctomycetota bacterium]
MTTPHDQNEHQGCCDAEHTRPATLDRWVRWATTATRRRFLGLSAFLVLALPRWARAVADAGPCGLPPPEKPAQASAAEGLPPLPMPATPQRRTEKKNPPRPPVIAVKIRTEKVQDWGTDPNDLNNLLIWMKANLGINFTYDEKPLGEIDLESGNVPVLYRTGHTEFSFSSDERRRLREYLLRGGMIIFDACCGKKAFADSARLEIAAIMPERKLKPVPIDHPIFNCYYQNAGVVHFTPISNLPSPGPSGIEGVEVGCRMLMVFSPHDLSCGWDMHTHLIQGNTYIESEDGLKIGANYIAYATATRDLSVGLTQAKAYTDAEKTRADKFRVGQIVHDGDWNPDPVGLQNLLDTVGQTTSIKLSFATEPVQVDAASLSKFPFVYMTGHDDFIWNDAQVAAMKRYLDNGGFLFADACCGRQKFDAAFRREMGKVFAGDGGPARFQTVPATHPLYHLQNDIKTVRFTEAAVARGGAGRGDQPKLEAISIRNRLAVVYSPFALNVGWRVKAVPYAVGYDPKSSLELGVNTVMYALSQ